ncbi:MAG TPA: DUF1016 N-terminal domain-containing protein [Tepidisphaeraceae bacterium]|nr:DUF1016 N-terminal domain-containing protein [Tepidisphaeraceae bacterium]
MESIPPAAGRGKAILSANAEMIRLYWDIGRLVLQRQKAKGWGASVIPRLARDIRNDLPEVKGFSERNIGRMIAFFRDYSVHLSILPRAVAKSLPARAGSILPQPVAKLSRSSGPLQELVVQLPWGHNILLMEKVKDLPTRLWLPEFD